MKKESIREAYGNALVALGTEFPDVIVLDADVGNSAKSAWFKESYPQRHYNFGIAEANMVAAAAGFASAGKIPFTNTFSAFLMLRAGDPVRSLVSYMNLNVKLAGAYAGLSAAYDGATHHCLGDLAFMRMLPHMTIISPADAEETRQAVHAAASFEGPVYLRLSREAFPPLYEAGDHHFALGKGVPMTDGNDLTIAATGSMVAKALEAQERLRKKSIRARVLNIHTIKPIDRELLIRAAKETGAFVVAEEHSVYGGLGGAVAEVLAKEYPVPMEFVGVNDTFAESGSYDALMDKYGLTADKIEKKALTVVKRK